MLLEYAQALESLQNCALAQNKSAFSACGAPVSEFGGDDSLLYALIGMAVLICIVLLLGFILWKQQKDQGKEGCPCWEWSPKSRTRRGSSQDWEVKTDMLHFARNVSIEGHMPVDLLETSSEFADMNTLDGDFVESHGENTDPFSADELNNGKKLSSDILSSMQKDI